MTQKMARALVWFRRDLRADDNAALYHALRAASQVWCAFVFDRDILDPLATIGIEITKKPVTCTEHVLTEPLLRGALHVF